jgi:hypothetical protein
MVLVTAPPIDSPRIEHDLNGGDWYALKSILSNFVNFGLRP